ncbi:MAG TPA: GNAT family N-acetyltransferase [Solirubrobacterales bacterium]
MRYQPAEWERAALRAREDVWRCAPHDAVVESGVEARWFGPVLATCFAELPEAPGMNAIQGAAEPGAVSGRHLEAAVEWMAAREVDYLIPVAQRRPESKLAEQWLDWHGCEQGAVLRHFARSVRPAPEGEVPGVEVRRLPSEPDEGLDCMLTGTDVVPFLAGFLFLDLPCMPGWSCYLAQLDGEPAACGSMRIDGGIALLCLDATMPAARGKGCQSALVRRRLADAAEAGCHTAVAMVPERPGPGSSPTARNLRRAGFSEAYRSVAWRASARIAVS